MYKTYQELKKYKVVRRFIGDKPVIEKTFDTVVEAQYYIDDAIKKENGLKFRSRFSIEINCEGFEIEEAAE